MPEVESWNTTLVLKLDLPALRVEPENFEVDIVNSYMGIFQLAVALGTKATWLELNASLADSSSGDSRELLNDWSLLNSLASIQMKSWVGAHNYEAYKFLDEEVKRQSRAALEVLGLKYSRYERGSLYIWIFATSTGLSLCSMGLKWMLNSWKLGNETYKVAGEVRKSDAEVRKIDSEIEKNLAEARELHAKASLTEAKSRLYDVHSKALELTVFDYMPDQSVRGIPGLDPTNVQRAVRGELTPEAYGKLITTLKSGSPEAIKLAADFEILWEDLLETKEDLDNSPASLVDVNISNDDNT